jgi:CopG antitoxin of type II toxin-antitoxin system
MNKSIIFILFLSLSMKTKEKAKTAEEFDRRFDEGEDIFDLADPVSVTCPGLEARRVNLDLPEHFLSKLDRQAALRGIARQSLVKVWLYERLKAERN